MRGFLRRLGGRPRVVLAFLVPLIGLPWVNPAVSSGQDFFGVPLIGQAEKDIEAQGASESTEEVEALPFELKVLLESYRKQRSEGFLRVNLGYAEKLGKELAFFKRGNKLEEANQASLELQRLEEESESLKGDGDFPAMDAGPAVKLRLSKELEIVFRDQVRLKSRGVTGLNKLFVTNLGKLKTRLKDAGDQEGALAVDQHIDALKAEIEALETLELDSLESSKGDLSTFLVDTRWEVASGGAKGTFLFKAGDRIHRIWGNDKPGFRVTYKVTGPLEIKYTTPADISKKKPLRTIRFAEDLQSFEQIGPDIEKVVKVESE